MQFQEALGIEHDLIVDRADHARIHAVIVERREHRANDLEPRPALVV